MLKMTYLWALSNSDWATIRERDSEYGRNGFWTRPGYQGNESELQ
jgi:hypothetical protein